MFRQNVKRFQDPNWNAKRSLAPKNPCKDSASICVNQGIVDMLLDKYNGTRTLHTVPLPDIALAPHNGTEAAPQLVNSWAIRAVPSVGYRPAYIHHHGHLHLGSLASYVVTYDMPAVQRQVLWRAC